MVLAGNFDVDLETLLVVLQRSLVLTLPVVNIPDVGVGRRHVRVLVAAYTDLGFQNRLVDFKGLVVVALVLVDDSLVLSSRGHFQRVLTAHL